MLASVIATVSLLLLLVTLAMMIYTAQKKCRKYISNKSLMPGNGKIPRHSCKYTHMYLVTGMYVCSMYVVANSLLHTSAVSGQCIYSVHIYTFSTLGMQ